MRSLGMRPWACEIYRETGVAVKKQVQGTFRLAFFGKLLESTELRSQTADSRKRGPGKSDVDSS
jgi:hypothetical protein